jgi:hypothetical protein
MATDIWAAAGAATTTGGAEAVVIITGGPGAAVTAITDKYSLDSLIVIHCPAISGIQRRERVAPSRRGRFNLPNTDGCDTDGGQPSPISTAIRIRSE